MIDLFSMSPDKIREAAAELRRKAAGEAQAQAEQAEKDRLKKLEAAKWDKLSPAEQADRLELEAQRKEAEAEAQRESERDETAEAIRRSHRETAARADMVAGFLLNAAQELVRLDGHRAEIYAKEVQLQRLGGPGASLYRATTWGMVGEALEQRAVELEAFEPTETYEPIAGHLRDLVRLIDPDGARVRSDRELRQASMRQSAHTGAVEAIARIQEEIANVTNGVIVTTPSWRSDTGMQHTELHGGGKIYNDIRTEEQRATRLERLREALAEAERKRDEHAQYAVQTTLKPTPPEQRAVYQPTPKQPPQRPDTPEWNGGLYPGEREWL